MRSMSPADLEIAVRPVAVVHRHRDIRAGCDVVILTAFGAGREPHELTAWCLVSICSRNGMRVPHVFAHEAWSLRARVLSLAEAMRACWIRLMFRVSSAGWSSRAGPVAGPWPPGAGNRSRGTTAGRGLGLVVGAGVASGLWCASCRRPARASGKAAGRRLPGWRRRLGCGRGYGWRSSRSSRVYRRGEPVGDLVQLTEPLQLGRRLVQDRGQMLPARLADQRRHLALHLERVKPTWCLTSSCSRNLPRVPQVLCSR